jgi:hypothetical protein
MRRVGQNRIYTLQMTVYLMESLQKVPYILRVYVVLANSKYAVRYAFGLYALTILPAP